MTHPSASDTTVPPSLERLSDELLAVRCQLGEPAAYDDLVARWHEPLSRYVASVLGHERAEDTVQDVWLRVLRAFPSLRDPSRLRAWLFGIARRTLMDRHRSTYAAAVEVALDDQLTPDVADDMDLEVESELERRDTLTRMSETLSAMPIIEREVLVLFYLRELSLAQIAEVLALPVGTVKSRLSRARRMLRERLIAQGVQS